MKSINEKVKIYYEIIRTQQMQRLMIKKLFKIKEKMAGFD